MIHTIGFDADDTLWHNETLYTQAKEQFEALLAGYGEAAAPRVRLDQIEEWNVRHYGYGIKSFALSMVEAALDVSGGKIEGARLAQILEIVKKMLIAPVEPFAPVEEILSGLARRYPLMLITKGDAFEQHRKIERSGLAGCFKYIEIVVDKTPDTYRAVLAKYHLAPQGFLMVGNSLRSDILPVVQIGGQAVYVPYANTWAHEHVDRSAFGGLQFYEVESLGQLPGLIAKLDQPV
jgi:putative hydrolase of the HAD superfamily